MEPTMFIVPVTRSTAPVSDLVRYVDDLLDRQASVRGYGTVRQATRTPKLDVAETDTTYTVTLDLPGVAREDVQVSAEGRKVTLKAELRRSDDQIDGQRLVWRERSVASFERSFVLPQEVDQASSNAKLENGVLTLTLAKRQPAAASRITIN
jgi:HSP20 family protein